MLCKELPNGLRYHPRPERLRSSGCSPAPHARGGVPSGTSSPERGGVGYAPSGVLVISTSSIRRGGIGHHPGALPGRDNVTLTEPTPSHRNCPKTRRLPPVGCITLTGTVRHCVAEWEDRCALGQCHYTCPSGQC